MPPPDLRQQQSPTNSPRGNNRKPEIAELSSKTLMFTPRGSNRPRGSAGISTPKSSNTNSAQSRGGSGGIFFTTAGSSQGSNGGKQTGRSGAQTSRSVQGTHPGSRESTSAGAAFARRNNSNVYAAGSSTPAIPLRNQLSLGGIGGGPQSPQGCMTAPHGGSAALHVPGSMRYFPAPAGILPELAAPHSSRSSGHPLVSGAPRSHRDHYVSSRTAGRLHHGMGGKGGGSQSPTPASLSVITSVAGDPLLFSETNMDWSKLNIFRTRLCDRLTQTRSCHMANRCLFSHDVNWPRRTPFLPRATALTLRYIPVWCPRLSWPPLVGYCDSSGKMSWTSTDESWNARLCHQNCTRGENCPFVHNVEEFLYHPEIYKTRSCCLANDDNFDEQMNGSCVALCPWYFCPFAHDVYELRNLRESRYAWYPPPQIVADDHVARTQDFNDLEKRIIDFVRRSPNGSLGLYSSPDSPLSPRWRERMPPVIRPIAGSSLEKLVPSADHLHGRLDNALLHLMVLASFANLLLYPVENFYVPTLLSLQCAVLHSQLRLPPDQPVYDCATLLEKFEEFQRANEQRQREELPADTVSPGCSHLDQTASDQTLRPSPRLVPEWEITGAVGSGTQYGGLMGAGPVSMLDFLSPSAFGLETGGGGGEMGVSSAGELPIHRSSGVSNDRREQGLAVGLAPQATAPTTPLVDLGGLGALHTLIAETVATPIGPSSISATGIDTAVSSPRPSAAALSLSLPTTTTLPTVPGVSAAPATPTTQPSATQASPTTEELQAIVDLIKSEDQAIQDLIKPEVLLQMLQLAINAGASPAMTASTVTADVASASAAVPSGIAGNVARSSTSPALSTAANTSPATPTNLADHMCIASQTEAAVSSPIDDGIASEWAASQALFAEAVTAVAGPGSVGDTIAGLSASPLPSEATLETAVDPSALAPRTCALATLSNDAAAA